MKTSNGMKTKRQEKNFWPALPRSFFCLAPMADVTDSAFRAMFAKYGKPDVLWTEFVSADGLCSVGQEKLLHMLKFSEKERPIVAQIFGAKPENIKQAAALIAGLGFDGLDLNMGCPDKSVMKQGSGAAHIKDAKLAREIIRAALEGVNSTKNPIPISVKTRIGFNKKDELEVWVGELIKEDISALTIHARTKKEMSDVPADWSQVKKVVDIVRASAKNILVIGNGDVKGIANGEQKARETGCDGIMIGRGAFGKPWLFSKNKEEPTLKKKLEIMLEHTKLFEKMLGGEKNFAVMKKHFKAYVNGFPGAGDLRVKLMATNSYKEIKAVVNSFPLA